MELGEERVLVSEQEPDVALERDAVLVVVRVPDEAQVLALELDGVPVLVQVQAVVLVLALERVRGEAQVVEQVPDAVLVLVPVLALVLGEVPELGDHRCFHHWFELEWCRARCSSVDVERGIRPENFRGSCDRNRRCRCIRHKIRLGTHHNKVGLCIQTHSSKNPDSRSRVGTRTGNTRV